MRIIYNILFPLVFLFFLPGLIYKLIWRSGYKKTFAERFGIFGKRAAVLRSYKGAVWIHAVSVGETMIALALLKKWMQSAPDKKFILSTTTTTGQELARSKVPAGVEVIFCPLDLIFFVRHVMKLIQPSVLAILETEIWPNLLAEAQKYGKVVLVNGRMSDKSSKGYQRFKVFFRPVFELFDLACVQTDEDKKRYLSVAPDLKVEVCGNIKFDQEIPDKLPDLGIHQYFGTEESKIVLAASTHPGEEKLIAEIIIRLKQKYKNLKLIIVPRHAERGSDIASMLLSINMTFCRRSLGEKPASPVDCLLADTTGEMLAFIKISDIVIMGKSFAGHDEGHNLIEPALMAKPIVTGAVLKNFRFVLNALLKENAVITAENEDVLEEKITYLLETPVIAEGFGIRASAAIGKHKGAVNRILKSINNIKK